MIRAALTLLFEIATVLVVGLVVGFVIVLVTSYVGDWIAGKISR